MPPAIASPKEEPELLNILINLANVEDKELGMLFGSPY